MTSVRHTGANGMAAQSGLQGLIVVLLACFLAAVLAPGAYGQSADAEGEVVTLEGTHSDMQFLAGRSVRVGAIVNDDVFAAGRNVTFESATVRNAFVGGYDVELRGGTLADMIAVGANVRIGGAIEDDLASAGRSVRISPEGSVGGDARIAGETVEMEGNIAGSFRAAGRRITITGTVSGKADLVAERIVIGPQAVITGDLIYRSDSDPEIAEGATIGGEVRQVKTELPDMTAIVGFGIAVVLGWAIAMLLLVAVVHFAFPGLMNAAAGALQARPWSNLGRGIVLWLIAVTVAGLLLVSVIGIPLGGALALAVAILAVFGMAAVSLCIGLAIRGLMKRPPEAGRGGRIGWALVGAVVLAIVCLIPLVGSIVSGLAVAAGFGATASEMWRRMRSA